MVMLDMASKKNSVVGSQFFKKLSSSNTKSTNSLFTIRFYLHLYTDDPSILNHYLHSSSQLLDQLETILWPSIEDDNGKNQ